MASCEPWAATSELRQVLEEALASYDTAEASDADEDTAIVRDVEPDEPARIVDPDRPVEPTGSDEPDPSAQPARSAPDYLDQLLRLKAEFENYRKRVQRDSEALVLRAGEGVLESLLPVLDNMARTLEAAERHEEGQLIKGVELVSGQLRAVLEGHGLDEVPAAPGLPFDPTVHEAVVAQDSDDYVEGEIVAVLEAGYLLHGRLLRPARVIVAR